MQSQNRTLLIVLIVAAVVICCWCAIMGGVGAVLVGLPIRSARTEPQVMITRVVTRVATPAQAARASVTPARVDTGARPAGARDAGTRHASQPGGGHAAGRGYVGRTRPVFPGAGDRRAAGARS